MYLFVIFNLKERDRQKRQSKGYQTLYICIVDFFVIYYGVKINFSFQNSYSHQCHQYSLKYYRLIVLGGERRLKFTCTFEKSNE